MKLSAELLDTWDRCERRFAFDQTYEPKTISPLGMLYVSLEAALLDTDPEQAAKDACMRVAARQELIVADLNPFMTVRHVGYLAAIVAVALRERLGPLKKCDIAPNWKSALFEAEDGKRHRIELVSHWDDDRLRACAHSWRVIGELAALESPLTLTTVVIGPQRGGRRHSEWMKGLLHPANKVLRFAPRNAKKTGFNDSWEKVWRELRSEIDTATWLAAMRKDDVLDGLIQSREIAYRPLDHRMIAAKREMEYLAVMMEGASESAPMRRSSCDETGRGACPYQSVCYSPDEATPADFPGLYRIRDTPVTEQA
jgi:hypothetical protein